MIIKCIKETLLINSSKSGSYWEETHKTRVLINDILECDIITFNSSKEGYCKFVDSTKKYPYLEQDLEQIRILK